MRWQLLHIFPLFVLLLIFAMFWNMQNTVGFIGTFCWPSSAIPKWIVFLSISLWLGIVEISRYLLCFIVNHVGFYTWTNSTIDMYLFVARLFASQRMFVKSLRIVYAWLLYTICLRVFVDFRVPASAAPSTSALAADWASSPTLLPFRLALPILNSLDVSG